ncbi:MAG TPA: RNA polymerase sigma factor [Ktedonobacteraceae bacterium]|nr:RNA polymerase sigma factor [Ktedonobacteraceae bacterium]
MAIEWQNTSDLGGQQDGILAQQALQGDEWAFETLVHRYDSYLFCFIVRILGDYDRACDVHQQVLYQLYRSLGSLSLDKPLKPWLFRVAYNRCIDETRRRRYVHFSELEGAGEERETELDQIVDPSTQPERQAEQHDLQASLLQAIRQLPSHYQQIVLMRYTGQLTFPEIGRTLQIPASTAKTYFHRASIHLRELLGNHLYDLLPEYH